MFFLLEGFQVRNKCTKSKELGLEFLQEEFFGAQPEGRILVFISRAGRSCVFQFRTGKKVLKNF